MLRRPAGNLELDVVLAALARDRAKSRLSPLPHL
jgi:hypothetical protein